MVRDKKLFIVNIQMASKTFSRVQESAFVRNWEWPKVAINSWLAWLLTWNMNRTLVLHSLPESRSSHLGTFAAVELIILFNIVFLVFWLLLPRVQYGRWQKYVLIQILTRRFCRVAAVSRNNRANPNQNNNKKEQSTNDMRLKHTKSSIHFWLSWPWNGWQ